MCVFDQMERQPPEPVGHAESYAYFLNRAGGEFWQDVRDLIEDWFSRHREAAQPDVRARFVPLTVVSLTGRFWLYVHETLRRSGFDLICHPEVPGTARRPDFLARGGESDFYVEARAISKSDEWVAAENRRNVVYDALNTIESPDFYLWIDVDQQGPTDLATRPLRQALVRWLGSLDADEQGRAMRDRGLQGLEGRGAALRSIVRESGPRMTSEKSCRPPAVTGWTAATAVDLSRGTVLVAEELRQLGRDHLRGGVDALMADSREHHHPCVC